MITNIDENMGRLVQFLEAHDLADDTILIFMTDNGSSGGWTSDGRGYNAGMRGKKGSYYDSTPRCRSAIPGGRRAPACRARGVVGRNFSSLELFDHVATLPVEPGAKEVTFHLQITQTGGTHLEAWFINAETDDPHEQGAYYVYVERLDSD